MDLIRACIEAGAYLETTHVQLREIQRGIVLPDVIHVLRNGRHEKRKDRFDEVYQAWNYAVRGRD